MNHRNQQLTDEFHVRAVELEAERIAHIARTENVEPSTEIEQRICLVNKRLLLLDQDQDDLWLELMNPQHDSFPEYIQAVVQIAFVSRFSVVLPITPVLVSDPLPDKYAPGCLQTLQDEASNVGRENGRHRSVGA